MVAGDVAEIARAMNIQILSVVLLAGVFVLGACTDREAEAQARAQAQAEAAERDAGQAEADFEAAVASQNWALAKAQLDVIQMRWPQTQVAERVLARRDEVEGQVHAQRETERLARLWRYSTLAVEGGQQVSVAIDARAPVDTGAGSSRVQLIFRDHPDWGRSSYLVLDNGDFARACYRSCRVSVTVDDGAPQRMAANRPDTDEAIAMFIDDHRALWQAIDGATTLAVTFPVEAGDTLTAEFEVGGLDRARLPGWN